MGVLDGYHLVIVVALLAFLCSEAGHQPAVEMFPPQYAMVDRVVQTVPQRASRHRVEWPAVRPHGNSHPVPMQDHWRYLSPIDQVGRARYPLCEVKRTRLLGMYTEDGLHTLYCQADTGPVLDQVVPDEAAHVIPEGTFIVRVSGIPGVFWVDDHGRGEWYTNYAAKYEKIIGAQPKDRTLEREPAYLDELRSLTLSQATDTQMETVSLCRNLKHLELSVSLVTDEGFRAVQQLSSLVQCDIRYQPHSTPVTDAGLSQFQTLTKLEWLHFEKTVITDGGLSSLENLTALTHLCIRSPMIKGNGVRHLAGLHKLESLELGWPEMRLGGLRDPGLYTKETLDSFSEGLRHISSLPNLRRLSLNGAPVADAGLAHLRHLPNLEELALNWTPVTDEGVLYLGSMGALKAVRLRETSVSNEGMEALRRTLPQAWIGDFPPLSREPQD